MGGSPPSPTIIQAPPPPPVEAKPVETQSLQTQTALNEVSGQQQRLNMTLGSQLDQANSEFFTGQNIRQAQAIGSETRTTLQTQGEQGRQNIGAQGMQERLTQAQSQAYDNYKAQRNNQWAQQANKA